MEIEITWQAFEYEHSPKSADWFWVVWIIAVGIAVTAYLFNNLLFGIFILISAFSLSLYSSRKPNFLTFRLSEKNLFIGEKNIPFSSLQSFWIEDEKIIFQAESKIVPYIVIPLSKEIDRDNLKEYLLKHLEEEEHHEPLSQKIFERLGF